MFIFLSLKFFRTPIPEPLGVICKNLLMKSRNQNIFEKLRPNLNLQTITFKIMYDMSMLRHRFLNQRWGGGGGLNHLPLLFCKSVYNVSQLMGLSYTPVLKRKLVQMSNSSNRIIRYN